jgi:hypothetical protein
MSDGQTKMGMKMHGEHENAKIEGPNKKDNLKEDYR